MLEQFRIIMMIIIIIIIIFIINIIISSIINIIESNEPKPTPFIVRFSAVTAR